MAFPSIGQDTSFQQKKIAPVKADSAYFIGNFILPNSLIVRAKDEVINNELWNFEEDTGIFRLTAQFVSMYGGMDTLEVFYQTKLSFFPKFFESKAIAELDSSIFFSAGDSLANSLLENQREDPLQYSDLQQSGSLSRGIIVGNNQDFSLESGLQFELSGKLTDDINILASLTDRSIPIQPDGTTQNLREFDKVFIQLTTPSSRFELGDVDVSFENSVFAKLNRRLQGAAAYTRSKEGAYAGAASVVRGSFKSINFNGQDGVQGPYRLLGRDNEEFVIILAGTERVYVNGNLVSRGEQNEYIIDYGLGEIQFTNNLLMKDETRVLVEYEYIDQNFNRTLVAVEAEDFFANGRLRVGATVIRQADGDDLLSQQTLSESDIDILRQVGDNLDGAIVESAEPANASEASQNVFYIRTDTLFNGQTFSIFKNEPGSTQPQFEVRFSNVGSGQGTYIRSGGSVNGILFEWVGPNNGDYEPFRRLPAPESQQMAALHSEYLLSKNVSLFGEWAVSDYDRNRFSSLDNQDNVDISYLGGLKINELQTGIGLLNASIKRRYSGQDFEFFERTREVEFDRKWNITDFNKSSEGINEADFELQFTENSTLLANTGYIQRNNFEGWRQGSQFSSQNDLGFEINYSQDYVQTEDLNLSQNGKWFRQIGRISKPIDFDNFLLIPFVNGEQENRSQRNIISDSLRNDSFSFYEIGPGLGIEFEKVGVEYGFSFRRENGVLDNQFRKQSISLEQFTRLRISPSRFVNSTNSVRIRSKSVSEAFLSQGLDENRKALLIRSNTRYATKQEGWSGNVLYEVNTERKAILQETYIEVGAELGQFTWEDLNGDGVQQLDEFFPELSINEGTFIRQFLPSDELFPVVNLNLRLLNEIKPLRFLESGEGSLNEFLSQIYLRSRVDISENSTTDSIEDVYLLKLSTFRGANTLQGRFFIEKELDFLRGYSTSNLVFAFRRNQGVSQRSSEVVSTLLESYSVFSSYLISPTVDLELNVSQTIRTTNSTTFNTRNFDIKSLNIQPGISATLNRSWQTGFQFSYSEKEDRFPVNNSGVRLLKISNTNRVFLFRKIQANSRVELRNANLRGNSSALGRFELTEGTGEGTNVVWSLNGSYRLSDLIRLSFNYDGRTSQKGGNLQTVKLSVRAEF